MPKKFKTIREEAAGAVPVMGVSNVGGPVTDNNPPGPSKLVKALLRRKRPLKEDVSNHIDEFKSYAAQELGLQNVPNINLIDDRKAALDNTSFGSYSPSNKDINVNVAGRHVADVLRTLAHELVHHKQNEDGRLTHNAGETGSDFENEANSKAGVLMRNYGKRNPGIYEDYENT
jgi:hypothetical protein